MLIDKRYLALFESFCSSSGGSKFIRPSAASQPAIKFEWYGYYFWGYENASGYTFFGENMGVLEKEWTNYLEFLEDAQERESETE